MAISRYFRDGAKTGLVTFFGNPERLRLLEAIIPHIADLKDNLKRPLRILDVGAGIATHAASLARAGNKLTAVDPIEELLTAGKELYRHPNLEFIASSLPKLKEVQDKRFDVVYSIGVLQYVDPKERQEAFENMIKLLVPGGLLAIVWPLPMSREFQFPLSNKDIFHHINVINQKLPENQHIKITVGDLIPDPDNRMGVKEKNTPVSFHTIIGHVSALKLQNQDRLVDSPMTPTVSFRAKL